MEIKRAGEIMVSLDKYPHIPYWFTLRQAMAEMEHAEFEINGSNCPPRVLLVFDEKYQLLGTVRRRDIFRGLEPDFLSSLLMDERKRLFDAKADPNLKQVSLDKLMKSIMERVKRPVSDIMRIVKVTADYEDYIIKVIYEMVDNNITVVPVLKNNQVVGVVRSEDVFHEVAALLLDK